MREFFRFGTLASGISVTVTLKLTRTGTRKAVVNTVTVTSRMFDIDMAGNSATITVL